MIRNMKHNEGRRKTLISLRNLPPELDRIIRARAREREISLNRAVIGLLEEALGLARKRRGARRYDDLDSLAGTWSAKEAREFDAALAEQRRVDSEVWR